MKKYSRPFNKECTCVFCGKVFMSARTTTKYCSKNCRRNKPKVEKKCDICGTIFVSSNSRKRCCGSDECERERKRLCDRNVYVKRYSSSHPDYIPRDVRHEAHLERVKEKERKSKEYNDRIEQKRKEREEIKRRNIAYWQEYSEEHTCVECGKKYTAHYPLQKYCTKKCCNKASRKRNQTHKYKERYNGITVDTDISLFSLYEKFNGTCQLCGGLCDWNDKVKSNGTSVVGFNYPSCDHIVPISKGGLHSWDNVQLAHFGCNTIKGNNKELNDTCAIVGIKKGVLLYDDCRWSFAN